MAEMKSRPWLIAGALLAAAIAAVVIWQRWPKDELGDGFASGNGRIEATEYDIATKQAGRIAKVLVAEGDMVKAGQLLVAMDTGELESDLRQAEAALRQAREDKNQALALVTQRESDIRQARAAVNQ
ncbi:MAG TPA: biotin/lipoyl-binding protein, partial [Candidatus Binatia bacterium]